jgi:hypothetical protein
MWPWYFKHHESNRVSSTGFQPETLVFTAPSDCCVFHKFRACGVSVYNTQCLQHLVLRVTIACFEHAILVFVCLFVIILYSAACGYDIHLPFRSNENTQSENKIKLRTPTTTLFPLILVFTALSVCSTMRVTIAGFEPATTPGVCSTTVFQLS